MSDTIEDLMRGLYPYAESHGVIRGFPEQGRSTDAILESDDRNALRTEPLWPYFVAIALVAFLLDITLRRIDFTRCIGKHAQ